MGTSDIPEIRGRLTLDDSQVAEVFGKVGKQAETMGGQMRSSGAVGRLAMWNLGEQAGNLAESFGIPARAGNKLGNMIEDMSRGSFPRLALAMGGFIAVAGAAVMIINHLAEAKRKAREETIKTGTALMDEVLAMDKSRTASADLGKETYRLYVEKHKLAVLLGGLSIDAKKEELVLLQKELEATSPIRKRYGDITDEIESLKKHEDTYFKAKRIHLGIAQEELSMLEKKQRTLAAGPATPGAVAGTDSIDMLGPSNKEYAAYLKDQGAIALAQAQANNADEITLFDMQWASKLEQLRANKASEYSIEFEYTMMIIALREKEKAADMMRVQAAQRGVSSLAQTFQIMYSLGGSHARKYFTLWKTMALADATLAGLSSILNSYNFGSKIGGPILGGVFAGIAAMATGAQIAKIRSTEFTGGGADIGMGATGTYDANPTTGLPTSAAATPAASAGPVVNVYVYGSVMGDPTDIARALVPHIAQAQADGAY